jgi:hypothetical protein
VLGFQRQSPRPLRKHTHCGFQRPIPQPVLEHPQRCGVPNEQRTGWTLGAPSVRLKSLRRSASGAPMSVQINTWSNSKEVIALHRSDPSALNAGHEPRLEAGAERRLSVVASMPWLGSVCQDAPMAFALPMHGSAIAQQRS